jgi:hypothetical protein
MVKECQTTGEHENGEVGLRRMAILAKIGVTRRPSGATFLFVIPRNLSMRKSGENGELAAFQRL